MNAGQDLPRFTARPRPGSEGTSQRKLERLRLEVVRLRSRFSRAARDGRETFEAVDSDAYDIGMLAIIHLADFVARELPEDVASQLPQLARDGLRATRNIAAHNYAGLDNSRLWQTVTVHAPRLLDQIDAALAAYEAVSREAEPSDQQPTFE